MDFVFWAPEAGTYTFYASADDTGSVLLDNVSVLSNLNRFDISTATANLTVGQHTLTAKCTDTAGTVSGIGVRVFAPSGYELWNTGTLGLMPDGEIRFNDDTIADVTRVLIQENDIHEIYFGDFIEQWDLANNPNKGQLLIKHNINTATPSVVFNIVGNVTKPASSNYYHVPVEYIDGVRFTDSDPLVVEYIRSGDKGETGNIGPTGPQGERGERGFTGAAGSYTHDQDTPSSVWRIQHDLGYQYVVVELIDENDEVITGRYDHPTITMANANVTIASFDYSASGKAVVTVGGAGAKGDKGDPGAVTIAGAYVHDQSSASSVWTINHNLGQQYLVIELIDENDEAIIGRYDHPTITFANANTAIATFDFAASGKAVVSMGVGTGNIDVTLSSLTNSDYTMSLDSDGLLNLPNGGKVGNVQYVIQGNTRIGTDLYAPNTHDWVQLNYNNSTYVWANGDGAYIEANSRQWGMLNDGGTYLPGLLQAPLATKASNSPGVQGQICWDGNYIYICVATNTWKRSNLSSY